MNTETEKKRATNTYRHAHAHTTDRKECMHCSASHKWNAKRVYTEATIRSRHIHGHFGRKSSTSFSVYVKICRIPMIRSHIFYFHGPFHSKLHGWVSKQEINRARQRARLHTRTHKTCMFDLLFQYAVELKQKRNRLLRLFCSLYNVAEYLSAKPLCVYPNFLTKSNRIFLYQTHQMCTIT